MSLISYIIPILYYLTIIVLTFVLLSYIYLKYIFQYWKKQGIYYLEPSYPFGNIKKIFDGISHLSQVFENLYKKTQESHAGVYFLNNPAILIKDPKLLKHVLIKDFKSFYDRGVHFDEINDPLSGHLFRLTGLKWRNLRNKISPTFTSGKLKMMFPLLKKSGEQLQESLESKANSEQIVNVGDICSRYTIDVISSVAFGLEANSFKCPDNELRNFVQKFVLNSSSYFMSLMVNLAICTPNLMKLFKLRFFTNDLTEFMFRIVRNVTQFREENKIVRNDFLQLMIQLRNTGKISDENTAGDASVYDQKNKANSLKFEEIVAQCFIFIIAGYDTSATTMSFCLYELAKNPQTQKKVQEDIDRALAKYNGAFSYESITEMGYLEMTINETLRMYPPLGFLNRITTEDYKIPDTDNIVIPKDTQVVVSVLGLHRDPKYYPDPDQFRPDRFSPENEANIVPYTYLPFGDGPRICIGQRLGSMQTKIGLAMVLSKYNVHICPETRDKFNFVPGQLILNPFEELKLQISKR